MAGLDFARWRSDGKGIRKGIHGRIRARAYEESERAIRELLLSVDCRRFDVVFDEDFTTPPQDIGAMLGKSIAEAKLAIDATAISLILEQEWVCSPFAYVDSAYPFSTKTLEELNGVADEMPWQGAFDWHGDGISMPGLEGYSLAVNEYRLEKSRGQFRVDERVAADIAEMMVGLKYLRLINRAVLLSASEPFFVTAEDQDSYWMPVGVFRTGSDHR